MLFSTVTVTSGSDTGTGTLRAALSLASPGDNIDFAPAIREVDLSTAGLTLTQNVTLLNDLGTGSVTIKGNSSFTIFSVNSGVTASISGLNVTAGSGTSGGGLYNDGTLTLTGDTFTSNSAGTGAGIYNDAAGNLTMTDSTVSSNSTTGGPAGGINNNGGTLTLTGDTVSGNTGGQGGGGIASSGGAVSVTNSTVYNNSSPDNGGGGLSIEGGSVTLVDDTITGNSSQFGLGGGINSTAIVNATGTIIAGNTDSSGTGDANAGFSSGSSYNLIGDGTQSSIINGTNGNQVGTHASPIDPKLGSLANNGGPTQTFALLAGSPAIGTGVSADFPGTSTPITTDQRRPGPPGHAGHWRLPDARRLHHHRQRQPRSVGQPLYRFPQPARLQHDPSRRDQRRQQRAGQYDHRAGQNHLRFHHRGQQLVRPQRPAAGLQQHHHPGQRRYPPAR